MQQLDLLPKKVEPSLLIFLDYYPLLAFSISDLISFGGILQGLVLLLELIVGQSHPVECLGVTLIVFEGRLATLYYPLVVYRALPQ